MQKILITGASGQVGTELFLQLCQTVKPHQVVLSDIKAPTSVPAEHFQNLDVQDANALEQLLQQENITHIYHLAAILSATRRCFVADQSRKA